MSHKVFLLVVASSLHAWAQTPSVRTPPNPTAGSSFTISTTGQGPGTFYLVGPAHASKRDIRLGQDIEVSGQEAAVSGSYVAVVCHNQECGNALFQVMPGAPSRLNFLVHPSRVPVSIPNAINATALVHDQYGNTVTKPTKVDFLLSMASTPPSTRSADTARGIVWFQTGSGAKQGPLRIAASVGEVNEPRIIQQVASEACRLHVTATPAGRIVKVQTDLIRDCMGNPLPDGTVVSFTKTDAEGRSTVDVPIKKDRATTQFDLSRRALISVACGVVLGNEVSVGGRP